MRTPQKVLIFEYIKREREYTIPSRALPMCVKLRQHGFVYSQSRGDRFSRLGFLFLLRCFAAAPSKRDNDEQRRAHCSPWREFMETSKQKQYEMDNGIISIHRHFGKTERPSELVRNGVIRAAREAELLTANDANAILNLILESRSNTKGGLT